MSERSWLTGLGLCFCNVTFGISIAGFTALLSRPSWMFYPSEPLAFIAFLSVVQVAPFVPLALFDLVVCRIAPPRVLRLWRLLLLALAIVGIAIAIAWQIVGHKSYYFLLALVAAPLAVPAYRAVREWSAVLATVAAIFTVVTVIQLGFAGSLTLPFERPAIPDQSIALPGPVLIIVYDELSSDVLLKDGHIDASAFPNIAALAEDGVEFTDATTHYAFTFYSIPAMLSGRILLPNWDRQTIHEHNVLSKLAIHVPVRAYEEFFGDCLLANADCHHGYQGRPMRYALAHTIFFGGIAPRGFTRIGQHLFGPDFDGYLFWNYHSMVLSDLGSPDAAGTVFYYHALPPHYPYLRDSDGNITQLTNNRFHGDENFEAVWANYRNTVRFVDKRVGEIVARLRELGLYDRATIVFTSDHGIRPYIDQHGLELPGELSPLTPRVPLILKAPGLAPRRTDVDYQHVDFIPTLFDVLDIEWPEPFQGVSAFAPERPQRARVFFYGEPKPENRWVYDQMTRQWQRKPD